MAGRLIGDEYVVGLWKKSFATDLLWIATGSGPYEGERTPIADQPPVSTPFKGKRRVSLDIPSWSWLSCRSKLMYNYFPLKKPIPTVVEVGNVSSHDLGYLINGPLCLRGRIKSVLLPWDKVGPPSPGASFSYETSCWDAEKGQFLVNGLNRFSVGFITFDDAVLRGDNNLDRDSDDDAAWDEACSSEETYVTLSTLPGRKTVTLQCLAIAHSSLNSDRQNWLETGCVVKALVLEPVTMSQGTLSMVPAYKRIGLLSGTGKSTLYFADATETVVELH